MKWQNRLGLLGLSYLLAVPVLLAAKDVAVPASCTPQVNQALADLITSKTTQNVDNIMVCGVATAKSRLQGGGRHGSHHVTTLAVQLPAGNQVNVQVVSNDTLDGVVIVPAQAQVFAYGQGYVSHGLWAAGVHDVHCATHPGADNGWIFTGGVKIPASCPVSFGSIAVPAISGRGQPQIARPAELTDFSHGAGERAVQADTFADSVGFVTHVQYNNAGNYYSHLTDLIGLLHAAGIRHIRDGWASDWDATHYETLGYRRMCAAGIKLMLLPANQPSRAGLNAFQKYVNGCVEAWEGYNECDSYSVGEPSTLPNCVKAVAWLPAQRQSATDLGIASVGLSNSGGATFSHTGDISQFIDYQNIHTYRDNNQNPEDINAGNLPTADGYGYASLQWWMNLSRGNAANLPFMVTEVGYKSSPVVAKGEVPESIQAKYLARTLLVDFVVGIKRTYLYQFFDEPGDHWGVVHNDLSPKPAYTYIKNLVQMTTDVGMPFSPGKLAYKVTGTDATLRHLLLQKRDGSFYLVLWLGQNAWNNSEASAITIAPQSASLVLSGAHKAVTANSWSNTGAVITTQAGGSNIGLSVSDQITIVRIL